MTSPSSLWSFAVRHEQDVVTARQRAAQIGALLGFDTSEQTRIATAVSEIVRNAFRYAGGGVIEFSLEGEVAPQLLRITIADSGRGISNLDDVLSGRYQSTTGMGIGLVGTRRLMDRFDITSSGTGTTVTLHKLLPRRASFVGLAKYREIAERVRDQRPSSLVEEIQRQNQELLRTLNELQKRQDELVRLNRELEDTNRGVVALYAELDEKADHLRRADELKSRFLSNMTHEFRTPVNAILALSDLLDQQLSASSNASPPEIAYIRKSAEQLSELVNDLLDLAKVEAGKTVVRASEFTVANLFGALRGMLRPLLVNTSISLTFDAVDDLPLMRTDEGKVSQILRNFISNALKYTEQGEVRVSAALHADGRQVIFRVSDTGIGIAPDDLERIFEEFVQIEHRLQKTVKGTGLGLPLSKRLAELLGGRVWVDSELDVGSTFSVAVPIAFEAPADHRALKWQVDPNRTPILVLEDAEVEQLFFEKILKDTRYQLHPARTVAAAREIVRRVRPSAMVLDVLLDGDDCWQFLSEIKTDPDTRNIPVVIVSSINDARKGLALGADVYATKPIQRHWLLNTLDTLVGPAPRPTRVLVVDDQEAARYILRQLLKDPSYSVIEAVSGAEGIDRARESHPDVILLDLSLGDMNGREVLRRLKNDPSTAAPPVIIVTSNRLHPGEREELSLSAAAILSKEHLNRDTVRASIRNVTNHPGLLHG